ncbi:hypothetical protein [Vampirovibrio chlorellavorus]|uniref:hypothetical protein n=1 Tax=Vampirovibrio chlorellavorus TaxID=758823 RepID=UPI0026EF8DB8|nr:hypothetical protein [Vampirovibrio chlorellavorus]
MLLRLGIACLPLLAVILLCVIMFSGLGKSRALQTFPPSQPLLPSDQATQAIVVEPTNVVEANGAARPALIQADFRRLGITHATIHVPD